VGQLIIVDELPDGCIAKFVFVFYCKTYKKWGCVVCSTSVGGLGKLL
jgi:hypothetical protein